MNAFDMDFAQGLVTYLHGTDRVFCAVLDASHADLADAEARGVTLLSIESSPESASYDRSWANVCFGGLQRNRLFMEASPSLSALYVNTQGVQGG